MEVNPGEVDRLLEALFERYGYDFRSYSRASLERRLRQFLSTAGFRSVSGLLPAILDDPRLFARLAEAFSIPVTEMFRDPFFYAALRTEVFPLLRTWPYFKIWHAGCATGEEAYSLAILLREEGLLPRATIYATDFNDAALAIAREGIYDLQKLGPASRNYQQAGGQASLSEHYHARYGAAALDAALKDRITFSNHNLACDHVFGDMHLVFCRNVLIYFDRELQDRALGLFAESLVHGGFLCLGTKEDLRFSRHFEKFAVVDRKARIYRKTADA